MSYYRKKPVVIEAHQVTLSKGFDVVGWINASSSEPLAENTKGGIWIKTLEGTMLACFGDYVIKGVKGEFYPCKPDIFEATYDLADQHLPPAAQPATEKDK